MRLYIWKEAHSHRQFQTYDCRLTPQSSCRMSMYFFRLHNLQRAEEDKRKKQRRNRCRYANAALTLAPSRLFERPPLTPSDSLDEVAFQIPRCLPYVNIVWAFISSTTEIICSPRFLSKGHFTAKKASQLFDVPISD